MALSVVCPFGRLATVHTDGASPMRFVMADGRWPIVNSCVFTAVDRKLFLRITFFWWRDFRAASWYGAYCLGGVIH